MIILAIETSCDDTGVAILDIQKNGKVKIVADFVSSQNEIHAPWGGVVPNLATRAHYKNLPILLEQALGKVNAKKVDLIVVTNGPGLEPCLWAGINTARVLAKAMNKPIVGVNHLEGHIAANWLEVSLRNYQLPITKYQINPKSQIPNSKKVPSLFPAICLIVSGGHTQLVLVKKIGDYKIIGQTRDDAAGEAFDKVAKMLGLGYPGGPQIALNAKKGSKEAVILPRPMISSNDFDFSFSGLKTAVLYLLKELNFSASRQQLSGDLTQPTLQVASQPLARRSEFQVGTSSSQARVSFKLQDICASFQQAVIDVLIDKTIKSAQKYKARSIMLAGGVAANENLRKQMAYAAKTSNSQLLIPDLKYCTDNAAMIGLAGYWKFIRQGKGDKINKIIAEANLNF
jgi:N6-L-threonylcarbamoyladenine synthase